MPNCRDGGSNRYVCTVDFADDTVSALANSSHENNAVNAIQARQAGDRSGGTVASKALLDAVDGVNRALAH
jgi:hypothetical protein